MIKRTIKSAAGKSSITLEQAMAAVEHARELQREKLARKKTRRSRGRSNAAVTGKKSATSR